MGPFEGILVLDLTRAMAGPYCTMMLADLGARVIKIERPGKGDDTRGWGPPFQGDESVYFLSANRNKESLALDLKEAEDRALLWRMIEKADVLVENFRPGTMDKLGFGVEAVRARNAGLVYARITGFGSQGPHAHRPGYDLIAQGMGGFMGFTGHPGGAPTKVGLPVGDINAGMFLGYGIAAALYHRQATGEGQLVETSLYEGQLAQLTYQAGRVFRDPEDIPEGEGNRHPLIVPYATYPSRDGWVNLAVGSQGLWGRFLKAFELEHLAEDPRFADNPARVAHREELDAILTPALSKYSTAELLEKLEQAGVPSGPVRNVKEILDDPHTEAVEMVVEVPHQTLGSVRVMGLPVKFEKTPGRVRSGPPVLDQHGAELRQEFSGEG